MKLSQFPEAHPLARENELYKPELRQMIFGKGRSRYRVIFIIRKKEVVVLDIRHAAIDTHPPESLIPEKLM